VEDFAFLPSAAGRDPVGWYCKVSVPDQKMCRDLAFRAFGGVP
jgi:hypothetical protein